MPRLRGTHGAAMVTDSQIARAKRVPLTQLLTQDLGQPLHRYRSRWQWPCPFHAESTPGAFNVYVRSNTYHCYSCQAHGDGISWLRDYAGLSFEDAVLELCNEPQAHAAALQPTPRPAEPAPLPSWLLDAEQHVRRYAGHAQAVALWQDYRPLTTKTIAAYRLGYGTLPAYASACNHPRLVVPLIWNNEIVGLHGRALGCECGKWRGASRHPEHGKFLYNHATLKVCAGKPLFILENPADALLMEQEDPGACAVATLGVTMWRDEWTAWLRYFAPSFVIVAYDNDHAGCPSRAVYAQAKERAHQQWLARGQRGSFRAPQPAGYTLVNRLREAGLTQTYKYDWGAARAGADMGERLMGRV